VTCDIAVTLKVSHTLTATPNRYATSSVAFHTLSHPLDLSAFRSHVPYQNATGTERNETQRAIPADAASVRNPGLRQTSLKKVPGTKIVCKATSGFPLETHQQKVSNDEPLPPHPEPNLLKKTGWPVLFWIRKYTISIFQTQRD
jgi:hypothetical protein